MAEETSDVNFEEEDNNDEPLTESAARTEEKIRNMTEKLSQDIKNTISSFLGEYSGQQTNLNTETAKEIRIFMYDPEDNIESFIDWGENFNLDNHTSDISQLLNSDPFIRQIHSNLGIT